jgi:hypothetical protein
LEDFSIDVIDYHLDRLIPTGTHLLPLITIAMVTFTETTLAGAVAVFGGDFAPFFRQVLNEPSHIAKQQIRMLIINIRMHYLITIESVY